MGMWNITSDTRENRESKRSISSREASLPCEGSPGRAAGYTPSYSREYTASCIVTSLADSKKKPNAEQKRPLNLNELKDEEGVNNDGQEASEAIDDDEISAYLPARHFSSRRGSVSVKKNAILHDNFSDGVASIDLSSSFEKADHSQEATDEEIFMEEILNLARNSMDKRRSRVNSRSESRRSSFSMQYEQRRMSRT